MGAQRPNGMPDDALELIRHTHSAVTQIEKAIPVLASQLEAFGKLAERNAKIIDGNGGEGIITRISLTEKDLERYLRLSEDQASANLDEPGTRWRALGELAIAAVAITSLIMTLMGG